MKTTIKNFTGADEVEVGPHVCDYGSTVIITQWAGSMKFQFNLTADDARLMAAALIAAADDIEEVDDMLDSEEFAEIGRLMDKDND